MIGDLFAAGAKLIGGAGKALGGIVGVAGGLSAGGAAGGASLLNVAMNIFGGSKDDPWGMLNSPVAGHVLGAVGQELLRPDPVEERVRMERALESDRRKRIRENYGLPPERQRPGETAKRYQRQNGLMRSRGGPYTPSRMGG